MVATMTITMPLNYEGLSYPVIHLQHDLGVWLNKYPDYKYTTTTDWPNGVFTCHMPDEQMMLFVLEYPQYMARIQ